MTNIETIQSFVSAWSRLDSGELSEYFTEDGTYHNMPAQPISGKENVRAFIEAFSASWTETHWEILNIVEEAGTVFCERIDRTKSTQGNVDLPCFGVFEMENGKIKVWRDYFDLATYTGAMS
ncbi:MAG: limonene-1,2-epoxide hydrolase family protein [Halioglobus sp.]